MNSKIYGKNIEAIEKNKERSMTRSVTNQNTKSVSLSVITRKEQ